MFSRYYFVHILYWYIIFILIISLIVKLYSEQIATTFFSEPPNASYEEAIESFEQAEEFATEPNLENRLFLSKSYIAISKYEKAIYWLNEICEQQVVTKKDQNVQSEANELLQKYSSYLWKKNLKCSGLFYIFQ